MVSQVLLATHNRLYLFLLGEQMFEKVILVCW